MCNDTYVVLHWLDQPRAVVALFEKPRVAVSILWLSFLLPSGVY
jgi:hypothetical protein